MQKARLLHSSEEVEVLSIDPEKKQARIRSYGFERLLPLDALVFEEQRPPLPLLPEPPPSSARRQEIEIWLTAYLPTQHLQIEVRHGLEVPTFYVLWIAEGVTWHRLLYFLADSEKTQTFPLPVQRHPFPWRLALQWALLPSSVGVLPELSLWHFMIEKSQLYLPMPQKLEPEKNPPLAAANPPSSSGPPSPPPLPDFSKELPPKTLDLHIEKLAPSLQGASPETILSHQLLVLQRYLRACESRSYTSVVVIHGIGDMKLYREVERFCKSSGWSLQKLSEPPYLNGASRVDFWREKTSDKK